VGSTGICSESRKRSRSLLRALPRSQAIVIALAVLSTGDPSSVGSPSRMNSGRRARNGCCPALMPAE
jgi:hypothetical protein